MVYPSAPTAFACSQCSRPLPDDPTAIGAWRHGHLVLAGELDEEAVGLLLCPDCIEDEASGGYEEGSGD